MCEVDDCENPVVGQGLCRKHYNRKRRTGDPLGLRRKYATDKACAREGCDNLLSTRLRSKKNSRFCSKACYYADVRARVHPDRPCQHCGNAYTPWAPNQRFCRECLGPSKETKNGLRYAGMRHLYVYDVSWPEWKAMLARFDGKCWICQDEEATELDHCHESGTPRGALCQNCNTRLHVLERAGWLASAQAYLAGAPQRL